MTEETTREYLKCVLTETELKTQAEKMAQCITQISSLNADLKSAKKQLESDIARHEAELSSAAEKYRSGFEMRNIECRIDKIFETNTVRVIRLDIFETVRERPMTAEERQLMLDLQKKEESLATDEADLPDKDKGGYMRPRPPTTD